MEAQLSLLPVVLDQIIPTNRHLNSFPKRPSMNRAFNRAFCSKKITKKDSRPPRAYQTPLKAYDRQKKTPPLRLSERLICPMEAWGAKDKR